MYLQIMKEIHNLDRIHYSILKGDKSYMIAAKSFNFGLG